MELDITNLNILLEIIPESIQKYKSLRICTMVVVLFMLYCHGYILMSQLVKKFLMNGAIPKVNQHRLTNAIWHLIFCIWVILFSMASVWRVSDGNFIVALYQAVTVPHCNNTLFKLGGDMSSEITYLAAPVSYFLHQLYISATSSIAEPAVLSMGSLALFVLCGNFARCPHVTLQFLFLLSLNVGTVELARAIFALKSRCRGYRGPPAPAWLQAMAIPSLVLHILVWIAVNLYMFPTLYLSLPSVSEKGLPCPSATAYINIFLIFLAQQQIFDSPMWLIFKHAVRRPSERSTPKSLAAVVLLPYTSDLLPELRAIQMNFLLDALPTSAERRMIRKKILSAGTQTSTPISEGKADLLSIVKCVKILKRKMRNRYELKNTSETSVQEQDQERENAEDQDEVSAVSSENQEVTDIYIPVPPLPTPSDVTSYERAVEETPLQDVGGPGQGPGPADARHPSENVENATPEVGNPDNPDDSQNV